MRQLRGTCNILLLTALISCGGEDRAGPAGGFSRGPTLVVAQSAVIREIRDEIEAIGTVEANESVTITARVTDTISKVQFEDGQFVEKGQVLVELTSAQETALLDESLVNLSDAKRQHDRLKDLLQTNSVSESEVDDARARLSAAEARYQSVLASLDDRFVRSPFAGRVGFRRVSEGTLVTPSTPITNLDDLSVVKLDFKIPEVHLKRVHIDLELTAQPAAFPEMSFAATVRTMDSRLDPITRAATVRAIISEPNGFLLPGMLLTVRLITDQRQALMVPEIALVQRGSQAYVYIIKDGLAEMVQVTHGVRYQGWVEILSGLEVGDNVITEGVIKVRDGSPVQTEVLMKSAAALSSASGRAS